MAEALQFSSYTTLMLIENEKHKKTAGDSGVILASRIQRGVWKTQRLISGARSFAGSAQRLLGIVGVHPGLSGS